MPPPPIAGDALRNKLFRFPIAPAQPFRVTATARAIWAVFLVGSFCCAQTVPQETAHTTPKVELQSAPDEADHGDAAQVPKTTPSHRRDQLAHGLLLPSEASPPAFAISAASRDSGGLPSHAPPNNGAIKLKSLPRDILHDQKFFWVRPFRLGRADLPWAAAFAGTTAALIATDSQVGQRLTDSPPGNLFDFGHNASKAGGAAANLGTAGLFYIIGRWTGNERARRTGVLGWRVLADSFIIVESLKTATQRPRPSRDNGRLRNDNAEGDFFQGGRSFPSGHAIETFSLAALVACQYGHRRWVPWLAYGIAGLVSTARLLERKHFPSDVFVGGSLGFLIGRHVCHEAESSPAANPRRWQLAPSLSRSGGPALTFAWTF